MMTLLAGLLTIEKCAWDGDNSVVLPYGKQ